MNFFQYQDSILQICYGPLTGMILRKDVYLDPFLQYGKMCIYTHKIVFYFDDITIIISKNNSYYCYDDKGNVIDNNFNIIEEHYRWYIEVTDKIIVKTYYEDIHVFTMNYTDNTDIEFTSSYNFINSFISYSLWKINIIYDDNLYVKFSNVSPNINKSSKSFKSSLIYIYRIPSYTDNLSLHIYYNTKNSTYSCKYKENILKFKYESILEDETTEIIRTFTKNSLDKYSLNDMIYKVCRVINHPIMKELCQYVLSSLKE